MQETEMHPSGPRRIIGACFCQSPAQKWNTMDGAKDELQAFDPRNPEYRGKLWVRVVTPDRVYRHFFWKRLGGVVILAGLLVWSLVAGGIWGFLKYERDWKD